MRHVTTLVAVASILSGLPAGAAMAAPPSGLGDLVGARGAGGETQLGARGYSLQRSSGGATYWWNGDRRECARVVTWDGRFQSIESASASDCGKGGGNSDAAVALGVVAAIGLAAALASHNKKGGDSHSSDAHNVEYERGYNDGLYSGNYDRDDSEAYHEGYMAGDAERRNRVAANSSYVRGAPRIAQDACARAGDQFLNMPGGASVPVSVFDRGGGAYEITVAAGHYRARCSVDASGRVSRMDPF